MGEGGGGGGETEGPQVGFTIGRNNLLGTEHTAGIPGTYQYSLRLEVLTVSPHPQY